MQPIINDPIEYKLVSNITLIPVVPPSFFNLLKYIAMKYIALFSILLASVSIIGCKEKRVRYFQYEIVNNESICSLKHEDIFESKGLFECSIHFLEILVEILMMSYQKPFINKV